MFGNLTVCHVSDVCGVRIWFSGLRNASHGDFMNFLKTVSEDVQVPRFNLVIPYQREGKCENSKFKIYQKSG